MRGAESRGGEETGASLAPAPARQVAGRRCARVPADRRAGAVPLALLSGSRDLLADRGLGGKGAIEEVGLGLERRLDCGWR